MESMKDIETIHGKLGLGFFLANKIIEIIKVFLPQRHGGHREKNFIRESTEIF